MAKIDPITTSFEIEPIVKVGCLNLGCRNNINMAGCCNLKHIVIDEEGRCQAYEPRVKK